MRGRAQIGVGALWVSALSIASACSSGTGSTSTPADAGAPDATTTPSADAGPDAAAASGPELGPGSLTLTAKKSDGQPLAAARVVRQNAAGDVIDETMTGANGIAQVDGVPAMLTILFTRADGQLAPVTFMDVAAGDALQVVEPPPAPSSTSLGSINLSFEAGAFPHNTNLAVYLNIPTPCQHSGLYDGVSVLSIPVRADCARASNFIYAPTNGNLPGQDGGFAFAKDIALPSGGGTVDVGPLPHIAHGKRSAVTTGGVASVVNVFAIVGAQWIGLRQEGIGPFWAPVGVADAYQTNMEIETEADPRTHVTGIYQRDPATAAVEETLTPVVVSEALPLVTNVVVENAASGRSKATMTTNGAGSTATNAHSGIANFGGVGTNPPWTVVFRGDRVVLELPALPSDVMPPPTNALKDVEYVGGGFIPDYAAFRNRPVTLGMQLRPLLGGIVVTGVGAMKISTSSLQ